MIVAPPKAGKTTLLKEVANSLTNNYPELYLLVLLIDERPEEVTDMERSVAGRLSALPLTNFLRITSRWRKWFWNGPGGWWSRARMW